MKAMRTLACCVTTAAVLAAGAEEYTWTGSGGTSDWTDTANWSPAGTPGAGDTAVFSSEAPLTVSGDIAIASGFLSVNVTGSPVDISGVVSGDGGLCKVGSGILGLASANTYAGGTVVSNGVLRIENMSALGTSTAPVHLASDGAKRFGILNIHTAGTFEYPVLVDKNTATLSTPNNANICCTNFNVTLTGAITGTEDAVLALATGQGGKLTVDATIDLPGGLLLNYSSGSSIYYKKAVKVAGVDVNNGTASGTGSVYWYSSDNSFEYFNSSYKNNYACAKNAFGTNAICSFGYFEGPRSQYKLQNNDITIDRFDQSLSGDVAMKWDWRNMQGHEVYGGTGAGSRLVMRSTADTDSAALYKENLTLVWWPRGDYTYTTWSDYGVCRGRVSTMTGGIVVSNGTFAVTGTNAFPLASSLEIADGAEFRWNSASELSGGGLGSVMSISVSSQGTFSMSDDAVWPFASSVHELNLASDSSFEIPDGVAVTVMRMNIDGVAHFSGKFTGADNPAPGNAEPLGCLTGSGVITCLGEGANVVKMDAVWTGAGSDTDIKTAANWKTGVIPQFDTDFIRAFFSEPAEEGKGGTVSVSSFCRLDGMVFNGTCDVSVVPGDSAGQGIGLNSCGIVCTAGNEDRKYSVSVPLEIMLAQTWAVDEGTTLGIYGPVSTLLDGFKITKEGAGTFELHATNSTSVAEVYVTAGALSISGKNAFGAAGSCLYMQKGSTAVFRGGEYDAEINAQLGTSGDVLTFAKNTTNVFNGTVSCINGHSIKVENNACVEFNKPVSVDGWSYINGSGEGSVLRFNKKFTLGSGQHNSITYDFRAPENLFGNEVCLKYGGNIKILLNCDYAFNHVNPVWIWGVGSCIDICGHDNKIGSLELKTAYTYITNSGDKATLWIVQNTDTRREDNNGPYYPCRQWGDFGGPLTLGKLGAYPIVFTNRAVSSTGDIIIYSGKVAFCPNSSWTGAESVIVSNQSETAGANIEIRRSESLGKYTNVYLYDGGTMTLGVSGADESFEQRIGLLYIDGVKQPLGRYSAADGSGNPVVNGTIACSSLSGPGVLFVGGDGKGTSVIFR